MNARARSDLSWLSDLVSSPKAREALLQIIRRANKFNRSFQPVKIVGIGLSGSALRTDKPKDIDVVKVVHRRDIYPMWKVFKQRLTDNIYYIRELIEKLKRKGRVTMASLFRIREN